MVASTADVAQRRAHKNRFYVWMAGVFVLIAFGGFIPTYWARLATGSFSGAPIHHIHATLFFTWTLFFFVQTALVAAGRVADHRAWGLAGISLATAMAFTVVLLAIHSMQAAELINTGDQARRFSIVSLSSLVVFATLFTLAIIKSHRSEVHKRLMLLAMIPLMHAAMARIFLTLFAPPGTVGPPPVFVSVPPGLCVDLLIVAAVFYDWRTRGRPHPVYRVGGCAILAVQILCLPLSATTAWMSIATHIEALGG
jgi:hypothetical protein